MSIKSHAHQGAAFIEFAIALPLFITLILLIVDLGQALGQYFNMQRVAYETASYGATQVLPVGSVGPAHDGLRAKAAALLSLQDDHLIPGYSSGITSSFSWDGVARRGTVSVTIRAEIAVLLGVISLPVSVTSNAAYLLALWPPTTFTDFNNPSELRDCQNQPLHCEAKCINEDPQSGAILPIIRCYSECSPNVCIP